MEPVNKHSGTETESYHDFGSMCLLIGKKTLGSNRRCRKKALSEEVLRHIIS